MPEEYTEIEKLKQEKSLLQDKVKDLESTVKDLKKKLEKKDISKIRKVKRKVKKPTIVKAVLGGG
jgi:uncharacterized protein YlxW (UPF0749 family)